MSHSELQSVEEYAISAIFPEMSSCGVVDWIGSLFGGMQRKKVAGWEESHGRCGFQVSFWNHLPVPGAPRVVPDTDCVFYTEEN